MSYLSEEINGATVEEYITGRIVRINVNGEVFKFYAQSEGTDGIAVYIGHGVLSRETLKVIKRWAKKRGLKVGKWGRQKEFASNLRV